MAGWRDFLDPVAPTGRYLPWKEVAHATGLSRTTAWRLHRRDEFPRPYPISPGRVAYLEREVDAWKVWRQHLGPASQSAAADPDPGPDPGPSRARRRAAIAEPSPGPRRPPETTHRAPSASPAASRRKCAGGDERQIHFDF